MRVNQFVAQATGLSRRAVDRAIVEKRVKVNEAFAHVGQQVSETDVVSFDENEVNLSPYVLLAMNKPEGYVCSRNGQGHKTIYDLLPSNYRSLKTIGRLDKDSSGLLLLTNDGNLANSLLHPKFVKNKTYQAKLNQPLSEKDQDKISQSKVSLEGEPSNMKLKPTSDDRKNWEVKLAEGRNRQIRRTFEKLGYVVTKLNRTKFGDYSLDDLEGQLYAELYKE